MLTTKLAAILAGLAACAVTSLAATTPAANRAVAPVLAVFYSFDQTPSPDTVAHMKEELARILAPTGMELAWRSLADNHGSENYPEVVVMRFRGACEISTPIIYNELGFESGIAAGPRELAETQRSNGKMLPFGDVECDQLRRYLSSTVAAERPANRNGIFGRAMARVVAHEIYHMLTGSAAHAKQGIARAAHSRQDLTARKFDFAKPETEWLREWHNRAQLAGEALSPIDIASSSANESQSVDRQ